MGAPRGAIKDMENEEFVSMIWGGGQEEELFQNYRHAGISPRIRYRTNSFRIKQELMEAGMAVGSSNDLLIQNSRNQCVTVRQEGDPERLFLGWRAEAYLSPAAMAFSKFCRDWFQTPGHQYP